MITLTILFGLFLNWFIEITMGISLLL